MIEYSFPRYLASKRSVDDRGLNAVVWGEMTRQMMEFQAHHRLRILEVGAGIGTMLQRMVDGQMLTWADYVAIDAQPENIHYARQTLPDWFRKKGYPVEVFEDRFTACGYDLDLVANFHAMDLYDYLDQQSNQRSFNLLVAHAFLDLIDVPKTLPGLISLVRPGGWMYLTVNFDGLTAFEPTIDPQLDDEIIRLYHRTMDERLIHGQKSGDSRTGRKLFEWLQKAGLGILEAGASDWVVFARDGVYPADEKYFLYFILRFFEDSLSSHSDVDQAAFKNWLNTRRLQVDRGELVYIAHQIDFLVRVLE